MFPLRKSADKKLREEIKREGDMDTYRGDERCFEMYVLM